MEKDENIVKEAEEEAKRIHDLETANAAVTSVTNNAPKNSGSGKNLLIAVLIVLLLVAVCVILFVTGVFGGKSKNDNKNNGKENVVENKENTEKTNTENTNTENTNTENVEKPVDTPKYKEEQLTVDSPEVKKLFELFQGQLLYENVPDVDDYRIKIVATINYLNADDIVEKTCGDLNNYVFDGYYACNTGDTIPLIDPTTYQFTDEGIEYIKSRPVRTVTLEKFNETYKKLFGTEPTEAPKSVPHGCVSALYYDEVNKLYALDFMIPNSGCTGDTTVALDSITQENGNLILHVNYNAWENNHKIDITFKFDETTGNYIYSSMDYTPVE